MPTDRHITTRNRAGFTLIELLVVILIIGILAGLSWAVMGGAGAAARTAATRATLNQLDSLLAERMEAFRRHDFRNQAALLVGQYNNPSTANGITLTRQAAERMIRKDRFRAAFPSRFEDLFGLDGVDGDVDGSSGSFARDWTGTPNPHLTDPDFSDMGTGDDAPLAAVVMQLFAGTRPPLASRNLSNAQTYFDPEQHDPVTESSELLYLALTRGATFGVPLDSLDRIDSDRIQDTDLDGLLEILDDWGNPIRFYNWPTALMRAAGDVFDRGAANVLIFDAPPGTAVDVDWADTVDYTHPLKQDPDDPFGELTYYFDVLAPGYEIDRGTGPLLMAGFNDANYHSPNTWHRPLLVSAGPNEELGLGEPNAGDFSRLAFADLTDATGAAGPSGVIDSTEIEALGDNVTNRQQAGGN